MPHSLILKSTVCVHQHEANAFFFFFRFGTPNYRNGILFRDPSPCHGAQLCCPVWMNGLHQTVRRLNAEEEKQGNKRRTAVSNKAYPRRCFLASTLPQLERGRAPSNDAATALIVLYVTLAGVKAHRTTAAPAR